MHTPDARQINDTRTGNVRINSHEFATETQQTNGWKTFDRTKDFGAQRGRVSPPQERIETARQPVLDIF